MYSYLAAAKSGGKFVLRIEDTDLARSTRESEDSMVADLKWLGLEWDEGPYVRYPPPPFQHTLPLLNAFENHHPASSSSHTRRKDRHGEGS